MARRFGRIRLDARRIDVYQFGVLAVQVFLKEDLLSYLRRPQVGGRLAEPLRGEIERALGFQAATRYHTLSELIERLHCLIAAEDDSGEERRGDMNSRMAVKSPTKDLLVLTGTMEMK